MTVKLFVLGQSGSGKSTVACQLRYMSLIKGGAKIVYLLAPEWISVIVSILGVFVALVLPIILFKMQRNHKQIIYEVISERSLLLIRDEDAGVIEVLFSGKPVSDLHQVVLKLSNTGNLPIEIKDYENNSPIEIDFGIKAEVLRVEILETTPKRLKDREEASLELDNGKLHFEPLLLNTRDSITIRVLLTGFKGDINAVARIAGVQQIKRLNKKIETIQQMP